MTSSNANPTPSAVPIEGYQSPLEGHDFSREALLMEDFFSAIPERRRMAGDYNKVVVRDRQIMYVEDNDGQEPLEILLDEIPEGIAIVVVPMDEGDLEFHGEPRVRLEDEADSLIHLYLVPTDQLAVIEAKQAEIAELEVQLLEAEVELGRLLNPGRGF